MATPTSKPPRVIDPDIAALRQRHHEAVAALRDKRCSAAILKTIIEKRIPKMTEDDRRKLFDHMSQFVTPALKPLHETGM